MLKITNHQGNSNQNHRDITSHRSEWLSSKRTQITSVSKDVEKREPSYTGVGNVKYVAAMENSLAILQKTKHRVAI